MSRDLVTFPLSQNAKFKLSNCGFINAEDLKGYKPGDLSKETGLTAEEALNVLETVFPESEKEKKCAELSCSAFDILAEEKSNSPISTSSHAMDEILGGGITLSKVTEICGCPGSGKTQLCLQLCANVTTPENLGGLNGEALFIDTEGSFVIQRLGQIAAATVRGCKEKIKDSRLLDISVEKVLKSIYYYPCKSYTELIARINLLQDFLEKHKKIRLIVIDSITFHFRYGFDGTYALRTRLLNGILQILVNVAHDHKVTAVKYHLRFSLNVQIRLETSLFQLQFGEQREFAGEQDEVVLTNQMTTKFDSDGSSHLIPALGESWGHACTARLILSWTESKRQAHLLKSPSLPERSAHYTINADGVRDIE